MQDNRCHLMWSGVSERVPPRHLITIGGKRKESHPSAASVPRIDHEVAVTWNNAAAALGCRAISGCVCTDSPSFPMRLKPRRELPGLLAIGGCRTRLWSFPHGLD